MKNKILIAFCLFAFAISSCQKNQFGEYKTTQPTHTPVNYYVSTSGSDNNNGLTQATAFLTIAKAVPYTQPGDIVNIMAGTYTITSTINIVNSGTADNYITFQALPGGGVPKLIFSGNIYYAVNINASYINFQGMELQGSNASLTLAAAMAAYTTAVGGGAPTGVYNTNGITIGPTSKTATVFPTHITVSNCIVHDFPAGGIGAGSADYVTIQGNTAYNNSWYTMYATSGIGIITPFDSDKSATGYRNIVINNTCYNNKTQVPWISIKALSDGNGIIIDVNTTSAGNGPAYTGKTLVENNVSFNNGGSGIHAFSAGNVDIINNTAYGNGQVVGYADIFASYSNNCRVINNIAYARTGGKTNDIKNNTNVTYDYNVYFNSSNILIMGAHDIVADPQFINPSTDPTVANFQLKATSPAVNAATLTIFALTDILGIKRPKGNGPDIGAYESF
jgi:parallel beta-helix repeat protein